MFLGDLGLLDGSLQTRVQTIARSFVAGADGGRLRFVAVGRQSAAADSGCASPTQSTWPPRPQVL